MLLELFRSLADGFPALNVFNYLTLRAVLAALTSMGIGFALGPWMIARLKNLHFGQAVRTDGPKTHLVKDGTPTMGGSFSSPSRFRLCSGPISPTASSGSCSS